LIYAGAVGESAGNARYESLAVLLRLRLGFVDPLISSTVTALTEELRSPSERGSLYADALADSLTLHLFQLGCHTKELALSPGELSSRALRRVRDRIEADLGDDGLFGDSDAISPEVGIRWRRGRDSNRRYRLLDAS
jgi:hypothetical protein